MSSWLRALDSPSARTATHTSSRRAVCQRKRTLRIPYHNKADGFMAALVLSLNQVKFCEIHACQPRIVWGMYPKCKYTGVRFPGRTPFYDAAHGPNAFEYYFLPVCDGAPAQSKAPMLTCDQRERVHRQLPWSVRTYYYGAGDPQPEPGHNESLTYDAAWYAGHRREGARLVSSYLRLQPALLAKVDRLAEQLFGQRSAEAPVLGVHLRGTDKGKYLQTAGSGRQVAPQEYEPYVRAFLAAYPRARIFVATDSPSFLQEVREKWPRGALRFVGEVLRDEANVAFGKEHKRDNFRKGEEVLLDTLLLSRCDWLLHAASGAEPAAPNCPRTPRAWPPARPPAARPPARREIAPPPRRRRGRVRNLLELAAPRALGALAVHAKPTAATVDEGRARGGVLTGGSSEQREPRVVNILVWVITKPTNVASRVASAARVSGQHAPQSPAPSRRAAPIALAWRAAPAARRRLDSEEPPIILCSQPASRRAF